MTIALQDPLLTLSGLDLLMGTPDPVNGWRIQALSDDFTLGDAEAAINSIVSQLQDGDLEKIDRFGNRIATVPLRIDAPGSGLPGDVIARGQAAVDAACRFDGWTELRMRSVLAGSQIDVFEVTSAVVTTPSNRDLAEVTVGVRYVTLTIHARPFVRGTTPTTIDAPPLVGSTTTTVSDGSSTTGWSALSSRPAALTNLATDPDFQASTGGFTPGANAQYAVQAADLSGLLVYTNIAPAGVSMYANSPAYAVTPGQNYSVSAQVLKKQATSGIVMVMRRWFDASGYQIGSDDNIALAIANSVTWTDIVSTGDNRAPAAATTMRIYPYTGTNSTGSAGFVLRHLTVAKVNPGDPAPWEFSGATADTAAVTYAWSGAVNGSTSTATWAAPTLATTASGVRCTVYGRPTASVCLAGGFDMSDLSYVRIRGTATAASDGQIIVNDNASAPYNPDPSGYSSLTLFSYSYNTTTGEFEVIVHRPGGFTNLDVTFLRRSGAVSTTGGLFVEVASVEITDNPFGTGKVQVRQVQIEGSQRTELSLEVLGLDAAGTTPVGLGEQVLVHTAAAGADGRAKFVSVRNASTAGGTSDTTAVSGFYNDLGTTSAPTSFTFPASVLLPGSYMPVARLRHSAQITNASLSLRAHVAAAGLTAYDPATGWKTAPLTILAAGAVWPQLGVNTWGMIPLPLLLLPPAELEDPDALITIEVACAVPVDLDDIFLCNADVGQASLLLTGNGAGSVSAVRLDAATVDHPLATGWVGVANGAMVADPSRWIGEQHQASPGLLQIGTVTPGCGTSRVSGSYPARNHTNTVAGTVTGG